MNHLSIFNFEPAKTHQLSRWHAVVFAAVFVISFSLLEAVNRHVFVNQKAIDFKTLNEFLKVTDKVQILFLGDSHFVEGIDSEVFDRKVFNLSFNGASFVQSYYLLKRYVDSLEALEVVVLPTDLHSFSSMRTRRITEPYFWNRFIDYDELRTANGWEGLYRNWFKELTLLDPTFGRKQFVKNLIALATGKAFERSSFSRESEQELAINIRRHFEGREAFDSSLLFYFGRLLELCRARGIHVVTLQTPLSRSHLAQASHYVTSKEVQSQTLKKGIVDKHLDYQNLFLNRDELFRADGDHLNEAGARIFSEVLKSDLDRSQILKGSR